MRKVGTKIFIANDLVMRRCLSCTSLFNDQYLLSQAAVTTFPGLKPCGLHHVLAVVRLHGASSLKILTGKFVDDGKRAIGIGGGAGAAAVGLNTQQQQLQQQQQPIIRASFTTVARGGISRQPTPSSNFFEGAEASSSLGSGAALSHRASLQSDAGPPLRDGGDHPTFPPLRPSPLEQHHLKRIQRGEGRRDVQRPWEPGKGKDLPSWLHILIRKRE